MGNPGGYSGMADFSGCWKLAVGSIVLVVLAFACGLWW